MARRAGPSVSLSCGLQVKKELAPWEKKMGEVNARISVAERESELLQRKEKEAKKRLETAQA